MRRAQPLAVVGVALALLVLSTLRVSAEWQIKGYVGATYGGESTFLFVGPNTLAPNPNHPHLAYGVSGLLIGEIVGVEVDFSHTPGFFQSSSASNDPLAIGVDDSGVYTLMGNVVVAMPRHLTQYTLRPYVVGGAGLMHVAFDTTRNVIQVSEPFQAMDLGAGVTGFVTRRVGLSWDVRYFRSIERSIQAGVSLGPERLSFWRASMAVAVRI
jgi:hypothetical protein